LCCSRKIKQIHALYYENPLQLRRPEQYLQRRDPVLNFPPGDMGTRSRFRSAGFHFSFAGPMPILLL
jgi:hypothetical protein